MNWEKILFQSGDLFLPVSVKRFLEIYLIGDDTSLFYVNIWSIVHLLSGVAVGFLLFQNNLYSTYFWTGFLIHTLWELWQILGKNTPYKTTRGQIDIITDTVFYLAGMYIVSIAKGGLKK